MEVCEPKVSDVTRGTVKGNGDGFLEIVCAEKNEILKLTYSEMVEI
jgi:hypothetical protein